MSKLDGRCRIVLHKTDDESFEILRFDWFDNSFLSTGFVTRIETVIKEDGPDHAFEYNLNEINEKLEIDDVVEIMANLGTEYLESGGGYWEPPEYELTAFLDNIKTQVITDFEGLSFILNMNEEMENNWKDWKYYKAREFDIL